MPASHDRPVEKIRAEATKKTEAYEWMATADLYRQALSLINPDREPSQAATTCEALARCCFKAAFQAKTRAEFKQRMKLAEEPYDKASALYERAGKGALSKLSKAASLYAAYWGKDSAADRAGIIERCTKLAGEAAQTSQSQEDKRQTAEAHLDLLRYLFLSMELTTDRTRLEGLFEKAMAIGEEAIGEFERLQEDQRILESLDLAAIVTTAYAQWILEQPQFEELSKKIEQFKTRIAEASGRLNTPHSRFLANEAAGWLSIVHQGDFANAANLFENAIPAAESIRDSWLVGRVYGGALYAAHWVGRCEQDADGARKVLEKALLFAQKAVDNLEIPSHGYLLDQVYGNYAECHTGLSISVETEREKKIEHLESAINIARRGLAYRTHTPLPLTTHALSKATQYLASIQVDAEEKARLLKEALLLREEATRAHDTLAPHAWDRGVMYNYSALIKAELANIEPEEEAKTNLLKSAVSDMQRCVGLCTKWATDPGTIRSLAFYNEMYGDILARLHQLTSDTETAREAIRIYSDALASRSKLGHVTATAAVRWKVAKVYDAVGDCRASAGAYRKAAEDYRQGAKKSLGFTSVFGELASYMDAWADIEEARLHHNEAQYSQAAKEYANAASKLQTTKAFSPLSDHYSACSLLEQSEALSRQEQEEAAVKSFSDTAKAFDEARTNLNHRLGEAVEPQDQQELRQWLKAAEEKRTYCLGRIDLETAKTLDKKGDRSASAAKYRSASEAFKTLLAEERHKQDHGEIQTLILFCDAWAKMKDAEEEASPETYAQASKSFLEAKETAPTKKFRLLAVANSSICKALEYGTQYRLTRNAQLYSDIKKQLETAADYYADADLENAAEWTCATQRMFDALVYLANAETEVDPKKKTGLYHLAEKNLDMAAKLYGEAGFQRKKNEALKALKRAHEAKELLLTPTEALSEHPATSKTSTPPVPLVRDHATGLEKLEAATVVGNLSVPQKEVEVGSGLTFELELANVGRNTATLIKLEGIAPDGFTLDERRTPYPSEDNAVNLRGKRLEYLQTHGVKISLKAVRKGKFDLSPKVLFVDEKGSYRSYEFDPTPITVGELGISGWIRGPS